MRSKAKDLSFAVLSRTIDLALLKIERDMFNAIDFDDMQF